MLFAKGNQAAAKRNKKAVAKIIYQRIEKEGADLPITQLTALAREFNKSTARPRRRRRGKQPEAKKVSQIFAGMLTGEDAEIHRMVLQIEAERLESGRKKWREEQEAKQKEQKPIPPEFIEPALPVAPSERRWLLKADV